MIRTQNVNLRIVSELDDLKLRADSRHEDLKRVFEILDERGEEIQMLKADKEKLVREVNRLLVKHERSEARRRVIRKGLGIILSVHILFCM